MAKMALQGGWCLTSLICEVAELLSSASKRAKEIYVGPGEKAKEKLEKIRGELATIDKKAGREGNIQSYNELFYIKIQLECIERELSLLDFYRLKKD